MYLQHLNIRTININKVLRMPSTTQNYITLFNGQSTRNTEGVKTQWNEFLTDQRRRFETYFCSVICFTRHKIGETPFSLTAPLTVSYYERIVVHCDKNL